MTIPLPNISNESTTDAWSYRATLQINQDTVRIDDASQRVLDLENRISSFKEEAANATTVAELVTAINNL